jgi:SAM-dependent methyltransferase
MTNTSNWARVAGRGIYPVAYAGWLTTPLRGLILPASRLANRLCLDPKDRVLEIGCGPGYFSPEVAKRLTQGRLFCLDLQDGMIARARARVKRNEARNVEFCVSPAETLPFPDASFDIAFLVTVLGETSNPDQVVRECARVIRPGGRLSITEAAGDPDRLPPAMLDGLTRACGFDLERTWRDALVATRNYLRATGAA